MRKLTLVCFTFLCISFLNAQGWEPVGARSNGLANASVTLIDAWSAHHNPGAGAFVEKTSIAAAYENRFMLKELQFQSMAAVIPFKKGAFTVGIQSNGFSLYRSSRFGAGYSLKLGENFAIGAQVSYMNLRITDYLQKGALSGEAGVLAKINDKVSFGFSVLNFTQAKLSEFQDDRFTTMLRMGVSYKLSSKVLILSELSKAYDHKISPKAALEYQMGKSFYLRCGASANPIEFTFGTGFVFKENIKLDLGSAWHQQLGWSPHIGLTFDLNKK